MSTRYHGVTVPESTDLADGPKAFRDLTDFGNATPIFTSLTERDAWASPPDGALCTVLKSTGVTRHTVYQYTVGVGWVPLEVATIGVIEMWPSATPPANYLLCNGQAVPAGPEYDTLRALVGANVPNLTDRFVLASGTRGIGTTGGAATVALTTAQMPSHSHTGLTGLGGTHNHTGTTDVTSIAHAHGQNVVAQNAAEAGKRADYFGDTNTGNTIPQGSNTQTADAPHSHTFTTSTVGNHNHAITAEGGGAAHENMPPFIVMAFIIRAR